MRTTKELLEAIVNNAGSERKAYALVDSRLIREAKEKLEKNTKAVKSNFMSTDDAFELVCGMAVQGQDEGNEEQQTALNVVHDFLANNIYE